MKNRRRRSLHKRSSLPETLESRLLLAADFTFALLPDTQIYAEAHPAIFDAQTQWLADNAQSKNIAFVSHIGDVVDNPDRLSEWQVADNAMDTLDGVLPYSVLPGNHDFEPVNSHGDASHFVSNFGSARYAGESWYGGASPDQLNHYQYFSGGGYDFLHLALEWEPRPSSLAWAQSVLDANPDTPTILSTHAYLHPSGGRFTGAVTNDGVDGEQLYQSLVSVNSQIFLVMNGHFSGEEHQVSTNNAGLTVFEMVTDYQNRANGGDGWLQLLNFRPDYNTIDVTTYSPTLNQFETDSDSQFSFSIDFDQRFNFSGRPTVDISSPLDNGIADLDAAFGTVRVATSQTAFRLQLTDTFPGIDDASVLSSSVQITQNGNALNSPTDYTLSYNSSTDEIILNPADGTFLDGTYEVTLNPNGSGIADLDGNPLATTVLTITIDQSTAAPPDSLYFTVNSAVTLNNGLAVENEDVVYFDGTDFTTWFDGSDVGITTRTINAMVVLSPSELLLSFTGASAIPGISRTVDDSDIVKFTASQLGETTAGSFSLYFDGSDVGLSTSDEDIDALTLLNDGTLIISTKGPFSVDGITGEDEDLLAFSPTSLGTSTTGSWALQFDGSDLANLSGEDIYGVSVYPTGDLYLSVSSNFSLNGIAGKDEDVFSFTPTTLGANTSGTFSSSLMFDGSQYGLSSYDVYSIHVPTAGPANIPPIAKDDQTSLNEDSNTVINVLADNGNGLDQDTDGVLMPNTVAVITSTGYGELINNGDGTFDYTPDPDFFGIDSFTYRVQDNGGAVSNTATVTITVAGINDAPVAVNDQVTTSEGARVTISVLNNNGEGADSDIDGSLMAGTVSATSTPSSGSLINNGDGTFDYTPNASFVGSDSFQYTVQDQDGAISNSATVAIIVGSSGEPTFYFAVDRSHTFLNGLSVANEDVIAFDGVDVSIVFDGSDVSVGGEKLNSISMISPTEILMSFSSDATLPGISGTVSPTDIVKFNATQLGATTAGTFELYFRGLNVGLDTSGESIDGLKRLDDGRLIISTLSSFNVPGASGNDEDLIEFTPSALGSATAGSWTFYFDGGDVEWSGQDVDAVSLDSAGNIYFSGNSDFTPSIGAVADEDVIVFTPTSLGNTTSGSYDSSLYFDGSDFGLSSVDMKAIDVTDFGPEALRAAIDVTTPAMSDGRPPLSFDDVAVVLPLAIAALDMDPQQFDTVSIHIDDLPGNQLGQAFGSAITLDRNAAGFGWNLSASERNARGFDLLTVLKHELNHVNGFGHSDTQPLMNPTLETEASVRTSANQSDFGFSSRPYQFTVPSLSRGPHSLFRFHKPEIQSTLELDLFDKFWSQLDADRHIQAEPDVPHHEIQDILTSNEAETRSSDDISWPDGDGKSPR